MIPQEQDVAPNPVEPTLAPGPRGKKYWFAGASYWSSWFRDQGVDDIMGSSGQEQTEQQQEAEAAPGFGGFGGFKF